MDLSLVPIDDLIKEIESRSESMVMAYCLYQDKKKMMNYHYGKGSWYLGCMLSSVLNNDVLNNWNGELRTLQRINQEEDDEK